MEPTPTAASRSWPVKRGNEPEDMISNQVGKKNLVWNLGATTLFIANLEFHGDVNRNFKTRISMVLSEAASFGIFPDDGFLSN